MHLRITASLVRGKPDFKIDGKKPEDSSIKFREKSGKTEVEFKLDDKTDMDLRFDCRGPFWDAKNCKSNCPNDGDTSDQTEVLECKSDKLTVLNKNSEECTVKYKMYFTDRHGGRHCVDPEWKNGVKS